MRIKPTHPSQGAWVVINEADFDPSWMVPYEESASSPPHSTLKEDDNAKRRKR